MIDSKRIKIANNTYQSKFVNINLYFNIFVLLTQKIENPAKYLVWYFITMNTWLPAYRLNFLIIIKIVDILT